MKKIAVCILLLFCVSGCGKTEGPATSNLFTDMEQPDTLEIMLETHIDLSDVTSIKCLRENPEQKDASVSAQYNAFNRMVSINALDNERSLFCIDEATGVIYFVNQGKDWFIYRLKDGKAELAVSLPAKELWMWKGTLYFMLDDYEIYELINAAEGDIYAYTPIDGSVTAVYAAGKEGKNHELYVEEKTVYFSYMTKGKIQVGEEEFDTLLTNYFYVPFGAIEPVTDEKSSTEIGNEELYARVGTNSETQLNQLILWYRQKPLEGPAAKVIGIRDLGCLMGNVVYGAHGAVVYINNLENGEEISYDCLEALKNAGHSGESGSSYGMIITSLVKTGEYIWAEANGHYLLRINTANGEIICHKLDSTKAIYQLYTDGENLYSVCTDSANQRSLVRILTDNIAETITSSADVEVPLLAIEELVK